MFIVTHSPEETRSVGRHIGAACRGGEVILLEGDLGAGKTTFAQGLSAGLDVDGPVVSPTFILLREYAGRLPLYHFDFYRLEGTGRAVDLEFDDYVGSAGVCVIEWPSCASELTPPEHLRVTLRVVDATRRELTLEGVGARHAALLRGLEAGAAPGVSP